MRTVRKKHSNMATTLWQHDFWDPKYFDVVDTTRPEQRNYGHVLDKLGYKNGK